MVKKADKQHSSDLSQKITESYGTGIREEVGLNIDGRTMRDSGDEYTPNLELTGGDVDAAFSQAAAMAGDEAVGGTTAIPDRNIVDELGTAVGLEMEDGEDLRTTDILNERDDRRWELDPTSSEDYQERRE